MRFTRMVRPTLKITLTTIQNRHPLAEHPLPPPPNTIIPDSSVSLRLLAVMCLVCCSCLSSWLTSPSLSPLGDLRGSSSTHEMLHEAFPTQSYEVEHRLGNGCRQRVEGHAPHSCARPIKHRHKLLTTDLPHTPVTADTPELEEQIGLLLETEDEQHLPTTAIDGKRLQPAVLVLGDQPIPGT